MNYDPDKHHRRSIRLKGYDYSKSGVYFITIVTHNHICLFGDVVDGNMVLNESGEIVSFTWNDLENHNQHIILDEFVIMPNHIHGIIFINMEGCQNINIVVGAGSEPAPTLIKSEPAPTKKRHGLPEIVRQFKTFSARRINEHHGSTGTSVWQRDYWEHIIRNDHDLNRIREYIINNPMQWELDNENPNRS